MGKIKLNKRDNYTIISNSVLKNKNLSLKAKGLYAYMWSLPDNWDYSVAGLVTLLKEGKDAINEALKELEREGYLVRTILRNGGKFSDMDYILHEYPQKVPFTENPQAEKSVTENPPQLNKNKTKEEKIKNHLPTVNEEAKPPKAKEKSSKEESIKEIYEDPRNACVLDALKLYHNWYKETHLGYKASSVAKWANLLKEYSQGDPILAVEIAKQSIANGWRNIYPLKKQLKQKKDTAISKPVEGKTVKTY